MRNAGALREGITATGRFKILSKEVGVPVVAFSLIDSTKYTVFDISESLRRFGWIVPAYTMPPDACYVAVLRVVVREDFSRGLAERLVHHLEEVLAELDAAPGRTASAAHLYGGKAAAEEIVVAWRRLADREKTSGVC